MEIPMLAAVLALRELIANATAAPVSVVARPTDDTAADAIQLWPWRIDLEHIVMPRVGDSENLPPIKVSCIVFAQNVDLLEFARVAIFRNALITRGSEKFFIAFDALDTANLLNLFVAAGLPPRPCLSYLLREGSATAAVRPVAAPL
jgi:hypothetical protein